MEIRHNITFNLRTYGKDRDKYQIRMRVTFNGQQLDFATGSSITDKTVWDPVSEMVSDGYVSPKGITGTDINNSLRNIRGQMATAFKFFEANDVYPTEKQLTDKFKERMTGVIPRKPEQQEKKKETKPKEPDFFKVFDEFMAECGEKNAWTDATYEKMHAMRADLVAFRKRLKFSDLTEKTLTEFVAYLRDSKKLRTPRKAKGDRDDYEEEDVVGLKNSTIEKKLGYLKWFLKWATNMGYNTNLTYRTFRPTLKHTQKKIIYLTNEEMRRLMSLEIPQDRKALESVRDVLIFCCFSGLRHSDVFNLRRSDIKGGHIEITTMKTADSLSIELNDVTRGILEKYREYTFKDNKALPVICNQTMNRNVKELCQMAGIDEEIRVTTYKGNKRIDEIKQKWELVGTHTGRKTFIVNALSLGVPPNIVMKWTGHSDYKAMKPYIDIVDSVKADSMTKFNGLL